MFESRDESGPPAPDAGREPAWFPPDAGPDPDAPLPAAPEDVLALQHDPGWVAAMEEDLFSEEAELLMLTARERFEHEYGVSDMPALGSIPVASTEGAARLTQDLAVQAQRVQNHAEARRVDALLTALEVSLQDLQVRFSSEIASRSGAGGSLFAKSMGMLTGMHPARVTYEVDTATVLRDRLPLTWARFQAGDTSWSRAQVVVKEAHGLDGEHWPAYDHAAADLVVDSTRLAAELKRTRERLQDDTAPARARTTRERRHVRVEKGADSAAELVLAGTATTWAPIEDALHRLAVAVHGTDEQHRTIAQLEHDLARDIMIEGLTRGNERLPAPLVPGRKSIDVRLFLTIPALAWLGRTTEQADLAGYGPIDMETAKALAGSATSFVRVLTDPVTGVRLAMDRTAYRPPVDLERWVRFRDGRSRFPTSSKNAWLCDIDHAREWRDDGLTEASNLVTLDRATHLLKSLGLLHELFRDDGSVRWLDVWGNEFIDPPCAPSDPAPADLLPDEPQDAPCPF